MTALTLPLATPRGRSLRWARRAVGVLVLLVAVAYLVRVADTGALRAAVHAVAARPLALAGAVLLYALAFAVRSWAWCRVLPGLPYGQSWAALHVSLLGNHVLPFRLGEALRVTSVLRRTDLPAGAVTASAVLLRTADLLAVLGLAAVAAPRLVTGLLGGWAWLAGVALLALGSGALAWLVRLRRGGAAVRLPGAGVAAAATGAWLAEAAVMWAAAAAAGIHLGYPGAVAVTAVTIAAQTVAVTPGGLGSYEAAATAALVGLGAPAGPALAAVLVAHATKTAYSLGTGTAALLTPAPTYFGHLRLPRARPPRPAREPITPGAPIVAMIPAYDEAASIGAVLAGLPAVACGHPVRALVVDDGSTDGTAAIAEAAGATVVRQPGNLGLGAAVRRGLTEAVRIGPAAVVYLDADGEYPPGDLDRLAAPVLDGRADYVIGSRFAGGRRDMRPHRTVGNLVLTRWLRHTARRRDITDGQSGYRAFTPGAAAHAEVIHDYNYAQVLTLDLLGKGYAYAEVPIDYAFRRTGTSFVKLGRYLRRVVPAVYKELNAPIPARPSTQDGPGRDRESVGSVAV
jgi:uncharacterized membrane protein YbhN (UPF0104 family)